MNLGETYFSIVRREPRLVCYWRMNDGVASPYAYDLGARYNLNAIMNGAPVSGPALIQADALAGSYAFGGAGVNADVPDISALRVVGDISLEAWVVPYSSAQTQVIVGKMGASGLLAGPYSLGLSGGFPVVALGTGTAQTTATGSRAPIVGIPSHLAVTSFRGVMTVYLNGVSVGSGATSTVTDAGQPLYIGGVGSAAGFSGLVGEVALYSGALSVARVRYHFNIGQQVLRDPGHYRLTSPPVYS